jgi:hypothetical protein
VETKVTRVLPSLSMVYLSISKYISEITQILKKKKDFICFQKVTLAVSKLRHLPLLRSGHVHAYPLYESRVFWPINQSIRERVSILQASQLANIIR